MNKKKIIIDVLVILAAFALFVIYYETKINNHAIASSSVQNYKVYLITMDKVTEFWNTLDQGASDMANMLGITYKWEAPVERNVDEQIKSIRKAIDEGADALLIAAIDPVKVSSVIEDAKAVNIKIIYVDSPANEEGIVTLATDNYSAGVTAGQAMISELGAVGIKTGSIGIVSATKETITYIDRIKGFQDTIIADGRFKLLTTKYTGGNEEAAREAPIAFINENPDLVGLFGTNEATTIGIGNAIKSSGKKIVGIGFNITDVIQKMINEGYLKAVMVQNPYTMGYLGMAEAVAALKAFDTGPPYINTGVTVKTEFTHN